jgi:hypothetical protein
MRNDEAVGCGILVFQGAMSLITLYVIVHFLIKFW